MPSNLLNNGNSAITSNQEGVVYTNPETERILKSKQTTVVSGGSSNKVVEKNNGVVKAINSGILINDIAQSHHYTVHLSNMQMSKFKLPSGTYSEFLPVKTMTFNYTSYENMSIPLAIFGDFPLLNKKRVSTMNLTCYDLDSNNLEKEIRDWEGMCFPKGKYAAYMEDIVRKVTYKGYNTKGKETLSVSLLVIPSGNVSVSRDLSMNDAKLISFGLVCVGDGVTTATGSGNGIGGDSNAENVKMEVSAGIMGQTLGRRIKMGEGII